MSLVYDFPKDYRPLLNTREVETAIKDIKDFFERNLAAALGLQRVTAPLFVRSGTAWSQQALLSASNRDLGDQFGKSVAISDDTIVVGAHREASVNADPTNNSALQAGAAYVFAPAQIPDADGDSIADAIDNCANAANAGPAIPAAMRRAVWARDEGRCAYVGHGGRCTQTRRLEFHHRVPFADGGGATIDNLTLRCRAHNGTEARRWSGEEGLACDDSDRTKSARPIVPAAHSRSFPTLTPPGTGRKWSPWSAVTAAGLGSSGSKTRPVSAPVVAYR